MKYLVRSGQRFAEATQASAKRFRRAGGKPPDGINAAWSLVRHEPQGCSVVEAADPRSLRSSCRVAGVPPDLGDAGDGRRRGRRRFSPSSYG